MSDRYFVDTNILMYAHDSAAGIKHQRARALIEYLWNSGTGVVSTQVLQEFCVNLRRKTGHPLTTKETRRILEDYRTWEIVVNDFSSILGALECEGRYKISFWDALIIQAAENAGVTALYSEDLTDGQVYGSVRVLNPLKTGVIP